MPTCGALGGMPSAPPADWVDADVVGCVDEELPPDDDEEELVESDCPHPPATEMSKRTSGRRVGRIMRFSGSYGRYDTTTSPGRGAGRRRRANRRRRSSGTGG